MLIQDTESALHIYRGATLDDLSYCRSKRLCNACQCKQQKQEIKYVSLPLTRSGCSWGSLWGQVYLPGRVFHATLGDRLR